MDDKIGEACSQQIKYQRYTEPYWYNLKKEKKKRRKKEGEYRITKIRRQTGEYC
jgi:hypothetical protein